MFPVAAAFVSILYSSVYRMRPSVANIRIIGYWSGSQAVTDINDSRDIKIEMLWRDAIEY